VVVVTDLRCLKEVVDQFHLKPFFRLNHRVVGATFCEASAKWTVTIQSPDETFQDTCDVLINASGLLNHWRWPAVAQLHDFRGPLVHTAAWPEGLNLKDKRVGLIGIGSSAIQVLPNIQREVKSCVVFIRSKTWIAPPREGELLSPETIERYRQHPEEHLE
jgi:cation diffusion facilitator CzcD-associated flavoprotein CzcO